MKFKISGAGWRIGNKLIPAGTVLDFAKPDKWTALAAGKIPFAAVPLDREALEAQVAAYPDAKHLLSGAWV
jgi:hypothetical protein